MSTSSISWGVNVVGGRADNLTPSYADCLEILSSWSLKGLSRLVQGLLFLYLSFAETTSTGKKNLIKTLSLTIFYAKGGRSVFLHNVCTNITKKNTAS